jgi:DNA helicase TIP49 (TBP-interacting protein)
VHDYDDGATATLLNFNDLQKYYNTIAQRAISGKSKDDESVVRVFNKLMNYFKEKGITEKTITTIDIQTPHPKKPRGNRNERKEKQNK